MAYTQEAIAKMKRYCLECGKAMPPIGMARKQGAKHLDWPDRKHHKKCWISRTHFNPEYEIPKKLYELPDGVDLGIDDYYSL